MSIYEVIGLQTPRGRLTFFVLASVVIFFLPVPWLAHLSLWQALGIPAPSIGLTRAYHLFLHGDLEAAWKRNPLVYAVLAIGLPLLARDLSIVWYNHKSARTRSSAD